MGLPTNQINDDAVNQAVSELDNFDENGNPVTPPAVEPPVVTPPIDPPQDPPMDPPAVPPTEPAIPPVEPAAADPAEEWRQKFKHSTREALVQRSKNIQFVNTVEEAENLPEPTEDEVKKANPGIDWELISDTEKRLLVAQYKSDRRWSMVHETVMATREVDAWVETVDKFLIDEKNIARFPRLSGHEAEFKIFATKESRIGVNLEDLARSFSFDVEPVRRNPSRAPLMPTATGGGIRPTKPKEMTAEEVSMLRKTNMREYNRLVAAGKINIEL